jgi:hypothetical protein
MQSAMSRESEQSAAGYKSENLKRYQYTFSTEAMTQLVPFNL